jgi:MFS family permease
MLPLALTGPVAFVILRAATGLATAIYDPAARGYLTDATPPERRGEAFGLYGAAQMGGLLLGPAIGAVGADRLGGIGFVFVFGGLAAILAAIPIALRSHETGPRTHAGHSPDATEFPPDSPSLARRAAVATAEDRLGVDGIPLTLLNRGLIAALVINAGGNFAAGTYEVIWSLFLQRLGERASG